MASLKYNILKKEINESAFTCGVRSIDEFIYNSYIENITQHAMTIECLIDNQVVGYCMITFKNIMLQNVPEEVAEYNTNLLDYCTSIHIQYMAVKKQYQRNGYGGKMMAYLLKYIMSLVNRIPIRLIILDAFKNLVDWYRSVGFKIIGDEKDYSDQDTVRMYIDCITEDNKNKLDTYSFI